MKRVYTLALTIKNDDGTGHKQSARVTVHQGGQVEATAPIALKITEQLIAGNTHGNARTQYGSVSFKLTNAEFTA